VTKTTSFRVDGIPMLMTGPLKWRLATGVQPVRESYEVPIAMLDRWREVEKAVKPIELEIDAGDAGGIPVKVKNLFVTRVYPSDNPRLARIEISDLRHFWPSTHVYRRYNIRTQIGTKRITSYGVDALAEVLPEVGYKAYSLNKGEPWTGLEVLEDVAADGLTSFIGLVKTATKLIDFGVIVTPAAKLLKPASIEGLVIDDPGDVAATRALSQVPGATVYVNYDGAIVFDSVANADGESDMIGDLGNAIWGGGNTGYTTRPGQRAGHVIALFTPKMEVRFDYDPADGSTESAAGTPRLECVIQNPWPSISIGGVVHPEGSWIELGALIAALNLIGGSGKLTKLSKALIGQMMVPGVGFGYVSSLAGLASLVDPLKRNWVAMIQAVEKHAFRTFRIPRDYLDRCLQIEDRMAAGIDPTGAGRASAIAYGNHSLVWSQLGRYASALGAGRIELATYVPGYPAGAKNGLGQPAITAGLQPAPWKPRLIDADQGILHLEDARDPAARRNEVLPGKMAPVPVIEANNVEGKPSIHNGYKRGHSADIPKMLPGTMQFAVILTCTPASALYRIHVDPADVKPLLPAAMHASLDTSSGYIRYIRVPASIETARMRWSDAKASEIASQFQRDPEIVDLSELVINGKDSSEKGASLTQIALAAAASYYAGARDRYDGSRTVLLKGTSVPVGSVDEIVHTVGTDGSPTTFIRFPGQGDSLDLFGFLDAGTRAVIHREVR